MSYMNELRIEPIRLINKAPPTPVQNPSTSNPGMMPEAILSMAAFKTKVNSPSVRMFNGKVRINAIGRKKAFSILRMAAANKAEKKPLT